MNNIMRQYIHFSILSILPSIFPYFSLHFTSEEKRPLY